MKKLVRLSGLIAVGFLFISLASCNVYTKLASPGNDAEYIQEAQKCLAERDYDCALTNYGLISNTDLRNEKVCLTNLVIAGFSLGTLIEVISNTDSGIEMMGQLASALMPWTQAKEDATVDAITECNKLSTITDSKKSSLLRVLAYMSDCGIRIAKTNLWVATSESAGSCNATTASTNDTSTLTASDIRSSGDGSISVGNPGMCEYDVLQCVDDLRQSSTILNLLGAEFQLILDNLDALPAAIKSGPLVTMTLRLSLGNTL